jgi:hypothetical protein
VRVSNDVMQRVSKSHRERRANAKRASLRRANAEDNARLRIGVAESLSVEEQRVRIKAARKKLKAELRGLAA